MRKSTKKIEIEIANAQRPEDNDIGQAILNFLDRFHGEHSVIEFPGGRSDILPSSEMDLSGKKEKYVLSGSSIIDNTYIHYAYFLSGNRLTDTLCFNCYSNKENPALYVYLRTFPTK